MHTPEGFDVFVNGMAPGPMCGLSVGDVVRLGDACTLFVSVLQRPILRPAEREDEGKECAVCRTPFTRQHTVYRCANCNTGMHAGSPGHRENDQLECARVVGDCPSCRKPLVWTESYVYENGKQKNPQNE